MIHVTFSDDLQYFINCMGGAAIFACAWWAFCFLVRNGIDGGKAVVRAIRHRKPLLLRKILIGAWKPLGEYEPIRPATTPQIWDTWKSL